MHSSAPAVESNQAGTVSSFCGIAGSAMIVFLAVSLMLTTMRYSAGLSLQGSDMLIAGGLCFFYTWWALSSEYRISWRKLWVYQFYLVIFLLALASILLVVSNRFYDISWDGQSYHANAIIQLSSGWNPLRGDPVGSGASWANPINYYPKGSWILATMIYRLLGTVEAAKATNFWLAAACFLLVLSELMEVLKKRRWTAVILSILLILNPVIITQSVSFYLDGQLAALFTSLIFLSLALLRRHNAYVFVALMANILLLINVKLTGLFITAVFCGGFLVWLMFTHRKLAKKYAVIIVAGSIIGAFLVGYNPYISNTISHKWQRAFTTAGIGPNAPINLRDRPGLENLFNSIFSRTNNSINPTRLKIPFTFNKEELSNLHYADIRVAGFGPLFGGVMVLSIGLFISLLFLYSRSGEKIWKDPYWVVVGLVGITVLIFPESWWARYAPQLWVLPVFSVILGLKVAHERLWITLLSAVTVIILGINSILVSYYYYSYQYENSLLMHRNLKILSTLTSSVNANFHYEVINQLRFQSMGIDYTNSDPLNCPNPVLLSPITLTQLCLEDPGLNKALKARLP
jgi:hypothetical protein